MTETEGVPPVSADQVRSVSLGTQRGGYDEELVDDFLDVVADQLEVAPAERTLTAQSVMSQVFTASRLRSGYSPQEVDHLLDAVSARLRTDELAAASERSTGEDPAEPDPSDLAGPGAAVGSATALPEVLPPSVEEEPAAEARGAGEPAASAQPQVDWEPRARELLAEVGSPRGGRFAMTGRLSKGYDRGAVDDLVDQVVTWLALAEPSLRSDQVERAAFDESRPGYDRAAVDRWVGQVADHLRTRGL